MGPGISTGYNFVIFLLSQPLDADFWNAWEIGSHLGPMKTGDLKLVTIEPSSGTASKARLNLNERYDRFPKTTFPGKGSLYFDN